MADSSDTRIVPSPLGVAPVDWRWACANMRVVPSTMVHYLVACAVQGVVALVWMLGVRRFMAPLSPGAWSRLLAFALALPPVLWIARRLEAPMLDGLGIVRVQAWIDSLRDAPAWALAAFWMLLGGAAFLFLLQEVAPAFVARRACSRPERSADPRLNAILEASVTRFAERGIVRRGHRVEVRRVETDAPTAALVGLVEPRILVSRGVLATFDEHELEAVVTHELAHLYRGGNLGRLAVWTLRALQATSPGALIAFRAFLQAEEQACDSLAASVTGRPAALASALLKFQGTATPSESGGILATARARVLHRGDVAATRLRVRRLLDGADRLATTRVEMAIALLLLGTLLWSIG